MTDASSNKPLADSPPTMCALCGEPMDSTHTAVAVMRADGTPGLVHPACYPVFAAQERARGVDVHSRPLYEPPADERSPA